MATELSLFALAPTPNATEPNALAFDLVPKAVDKSASATA